MFFHKNSGLFDTCTVYLSCKVITMCLRLCLKRNVTVANPAIVIICTEAAEQHDITQPK